MDSYELLRPAGIINYSGTMGYHLDLNNVPAQIQTAILDFHSKTDATVFYEGEGTYQPEFWIRDNLIKR